MLIVSIGTPDEVDERGIYYKHADARFYQAGAFLLGRQISQLPLVRSVVMMCLAVCETTNDSLLFH